MKSKKLYSILEKDFIKKGLSDDWADHMQEVEDFLCDNFKQRSMGLVCGNTETIERVYTAVFPTREVMQEVLDQGFENIMLFVHHPSIWDITKAPEVFQQMPIDLLEEFRKRKISIYNLHVPLDNLGDFSTSKTLADSLGINIEKPFAEYFGALAGVIGTTDCETLAELKTKFNQIVGHKVSLYPYGPDKMKNQRMAIVAGGGNDIDILTEIAQNNIDTFITGITVLNEHSKPSHDYAKKNKINLLGGTHYSTEMFACQAMCKYFEKLGLKSKFISGKPGLEDL